MSFKIICSKFARLFSKTYKVLRSHPGHLPRKILSKLKRIIENRFDLSFLHKNNVYISGNYYPAIDLMPSEIAQAAFQSTDHTVCVIIPVYRNVSVTKRCIDSVLRSEIPTATKILILNDCSPDPEMADFLNEYKKYKNVEVLHNEENLGFVKNVNLGMKLAGKSDVILLNSDTEVAGNWVHRLRACAYQSPKVSSVTATSNNATICSFPIMDGTPSWPKSKSTVEMQLILGRHNIGRSVSIPTAVGFCMYITRSSLEALGDFDAEAFGKGYGEENDFCLRGLRRGWKHLQALDVAVFHEGEVSFGNASHPGKHRAGEIILKRYPEYNMLVGDYAQKDPARAHRLGAMLSLIANLGKPVSLICTHIHGGGVQKAVDEFVNARLDQVSFLQLNRAGRKGFYSIKSLIPGIEFYLEFSSQFSAAVFYNVLQSAGVAQLEIHHVMDFDRPMLKLIQNSGLPFNFYIHDYWVICPQITLTTERGVYCGEPKPEVCNSCIARRGERTHAPLAAGLPLDIEKWRNQYKWLFEGASKIVAPSHDVANRISKYFTKGKETSSFVQVSYHEPQEPLQQTSIKLRSFEEASRKVLKVAVLGSIGVHKGFYIISDIQKEIVQSHAPIEISIFGEIDPLLKMEYPVKVHGRYRDEQLPELLTNYGIQLIWFPEGAPETYSYTLSHAMKLGYPVLAPMIGSFIERLKNRPWSQLMAKGASPKEVVSLLMDFREKIDSSYKV